MNVSIKYYYAADGSKMSVRYMNSNNIVEKQRYYFAGFSAESGSSLLCWDFGFSSRLRSMTRNAPRLLHGGQDDERHATIPTRAMRG